MADGTEARQTTTIKKAGGSLMVTVPASVRDALQLSEGQELTVAAEDGRLVYETLRRRPRYTLAELLAQCDPDIPFSDAEVAEREAWLNARPMGRELW